MNWKCPRCGNIREQSRMVVEGMVLFCQSCNSRWKVEFAEPWEQAKLVNTHDLRPDGISRCIK